MIFLSSVYDSEPVSPGKRVLVDRLWPRGISKEKINLSIWFKEIAPSSELRMWFSHEPEKWDEFRRRYFLELDKNPVTPDLLRYCKNEDVLFLFSAKNKEYNNAVALREYVLKHLDR